MSGTGWSATEMQITIGAGRLDKAAFTKVKPPAQGAFLHRATTANHV